MIPEAEILDTCTFTWDQLYELLFEALDLFQDYRDQYDYTEERAKQQAVLRTLQGLDLDSPLYADVLD
jgi:hypothetical protein